MKQKNETTDIITTCPHDREGIRKTNKKQKKRDQRTTEKLKLTETEFQNGTLKSDIIIPCDNSETNNEILDNTTGQEDILDQPNNEENAVNEKLHNTTKLEDIHDQPYNEEIVSNDDDCDEVIGCTDQLVKFSDDENQTSKAKKHEKSVEKSSTDDLPEEHGVELDVGNVTESGDTVENVHLGKHNVEIGVQEVNQNAMTDSKKTELQPIVEETEGQCVAKTDNDKMEAVQEKNNCSDCTVQAIVDVNKTRKLSIEFDSNVKRGENKGPMKQSPAKDSAKDSKQKYVSKRKQPKEQMNKSDIKRPQSVMERRDEKYDTLNSRRPLSAREIRSKSSVSTSSSRRYSRDPFRVTKRELEWHLPRKSNFDCHDKTLKDAGQESEEQVNRMEKMKQRIMERLKREKEARLKLQQNNTNVQNENSGKQSEAENKKDNVVFDLSKTENDEVDVNHGDEHIQTLVQENTQEGTHVSTNKHSTSSRKHSRLKKKGFDDDDDDIKVEYQPLVHYLKFVKENENDYHTHRRQSLETDWIGVKPTKRTLRMAQIIERKNRSLGHSTESVLVQAVQDIRPRVTDPSQWTIANKERALMNNLNSFNTRKEAAFTPAKPESRTHESDQNAEELKSEFEKEKVKLDRWLKTLPTAQILKAKELALKDLGEEDKYHSDWWNTLQTCSYLRQKGLKTPELK